MLITYSPAAGRDTLADASGASKDEANHWTLAMSKRRSPSVLLQLMTQVTRTIPDKGMLVRSPAAALVLL